MLVLQTVVRVNHESFYTLASYEELCLFENGFKPEIIVRADEEEVLFEVFLYLSVFPVAEVLLVELLSRELFYQLRGVIGERSVLGAEISETPTVTHIQAFGYFVDELRLTAAWNTCHDTEAFGLERTQAVEVVVPDCNTFLHTELKQCVERLFKILYRENPFNLRFGCVSKAFQQAFPSELYQVFVSVLAALAVFQYSAAFSPEASH